MTFELMQQIYLWGLLPTGLIASLHMGEFDNAGHTFACWLLWPLVLGFSAIFGLFATVFNWGWWR